MTRDEWLKIYLDEIAKAELQDAGQEAGADEREVRVTMIRANLRLVVKIAQEQQSNSNVPLMDLVTAGNLGLMKAVRRFDPSKEGKLSAYAAWWIKRSIKRTVAHSTKKFPFLSAETPYPKAPAQTMPTQESEEDLALPS